MGEDDRKSANEDASGIPRREVLTRTTLADSDVAVARRLLNETAGAAANHSAITMPGMAQATMPLRLNINGSDYQRRIEPRTTLLDALSAMRLPTAPNVASLQEGTITNIEPTIAHEPPASRAATEQQSGCGEKENSRHKP